MYFPRNFAGLVATLTVESLPNLKHCVELFLFPEKQKDRHLEGFRMRSSDVQRE